LSRPMLAAVPLGLTLLKKRETAEDIAKHGIAADKTEVDGITISPRIHEPAATGQIEEEPQEHQFFGRHMVASYTDCDIDALLNHEALEDAMGRAVVACGATLLDTVRFAYPEGGITIAMLLSESHASIHTYPEHASCFADLFTCGDRCRAEEFDAVMREYLKPKAANCKVLLRHAGIEEDGLKPRTA